MNQFNLNTISLISAAINNTHPHLSDDVNFEAIFKSFPRLTPLLYFGAIKSPLFIKCKCKPQILKLMSIEISKSNKQMKYLHKLCEKFDQNDINYCLLKGCEVRILYPNPIMRPMNDCDILINQEQYSKIKLIMQEEKYKNTYIGDHEFAWERTDGYQIELHYKLFAKETGFLYANTFYDKNKNHFLIPEYSFVYQIAHFAKHYKNYTPTIKSFLDLYIYRKEHKEMDTELISSLLSSLNLQEFYYSISETFDCWFKDAKYTKRSESLTNVLFVSHSEKSILSSMSLFTMISNKKGKLNIKSFINKYLFPNYYEMVRKFPSLKKWPVLLPFFWVNNIVSIVLKNIFGKSVSIKSLIKYNSDFYSTYTENMKIVGL